MTGEPSKQDKKLIRAMHVLAAALLLAAAAPLPSRAAAAPGETLFNSYCVACHSIGQGDKVGPDLKGVSELRKRAWLESWIEAPDKVLAAKDPVALSLLKKYRLPMPNLNLTHTQVTRIVDFLGAGGLAAPAAAAASAALARGDAARGKGLFTGVVRFRNGGAACMACHSIAGIGALGGGTMGPDLTAAYGKLKEAALSWPETTPPMRAIFSARPLTASEKADLLAFLKTAPLPQRSPAELGRLGALSGFGALALLLLLHLIWRRRLSRLQGVRRSVVKRG